MKHLFTLALLMGVVMITSMMGTGQQTPAMTAQPNTLFVNAEGKFEAAPDTTLLQFNISPQEDTAPAAYEHATRAAEQVRQLLKSNGVDPKNAEVGFFSLAPVYDWRQPKRKLVGYRVTSAVTLKLRDFTKVAPIAQQLANLDVTENQSLSYTLENIDAAKIRAVEDAYNRARNEGEAMAKAGGRTLGELYYGSVDTFEPVRVFAPMMKSQAMRAGVMANEQAPPAPTAEFTPQKVVVTARVTAMFLMK